MKDTYIISSCRVGWEKAFIEFKDKKENETLIPDVFEDETFD